MLQGAWFQVQQPKFGDNQLLWNIEERVCSCEAIDNRPDCRRGSLYVKTFTERVTATFSRHAVCKNSVGVADESGAAYGIGVEENETPCSINCSVDGPGLQRRCFSSFQPLRR